MDIFICDRSIFCQFDFRTVEDAGPYNACKDAFSFLRTYRQKNGLISIIACYGQKKKRRSLFADIVLFTKRIFGGQHQLRVRSSPFSE